jgi:multiple sugar transport system substrate-binding protein
MIEGVRQSCAWNGRPGAPLGTEDAMQWCIPWGYEQNNLSYNKRMFDEHGLSVPRNLDELIEVAAAAKAAKGSGYGIGVRGSRSWATIHPGFLSGYANYGQRDLVLGDDGTLSAAMNTDVSKEYHRKFVQLVQQSGAPDWATHTWYQVGNDLGAGVSAMIYDADILGYFQQNGTAEAGNIAYAPFAPNPEAQAPTPNIWIWSLAMSNFSEKKDPAWYFIQWASGPEHQLFGATQMDFVNPVRKSIWADETFRNRLTRATRDTSRCTTSRRPARASSSRPSRCSSTSPPNGPPRSSRWSPTRCRWTRGSTRSPRASTASSPTAACADPPAWPALRRGPGSRNLRRLRHGAGGDEGSR